MLLASVRLLGSGTFICSIHRSSFSVFSDDSYLTRDSYVTRIHVTPSENMNLVAVFDLARIKNEKKDCPELDYAVYLLPDL